MQAYLFKPLFQRILCAFFIRCSRVGNLQRSIDFYTQVLGMKLLRTSDNPEYQYTLGFPRLWQ